MKNYLLNRKTQSKRFQRKPILLPIGAIKQILLILNEPSESLRKACKDYFPSANVVTLFPRKENEDMTVMGEYSYHPKDFNLTGKLKNDKLKSLLKSEFNLVLDLSSENKINRFLIEGMNQTFMVGKTGLEKDLYYDLIVQSDTDENAFFDTTVKHIKLLTQE